MIYKYPKSTDPQTWSCTANKNKWGKDSTMPEIWACVAAACSVQQYSVNMKHRQVCSSFYAQTFNVIFCDAM